MDFDDLYQNGRKRDLSNGKKIRFCCIFLVVAVVTGLIVWKLVPRSPENAVPAKPGSQPQAVSSTEPVAGPEKSADVQEKTPPRSDSKKVFPSARKNLHPTAVEEPVLTQAGQGEVLLKGIPGKGDISPDSDKPYIPGENNKNADISGKIAELEQLFEQKKFTEVSRSGSALLKTLTTGSEQYRKVLSIFSLANWQRFLNRDTTDGFAVRHTVKSGDQLGVIARRNKTTVPALMKANRIKRADLIQIGQKIIVLRGSWSITVLKNCRLLILQRDGNVFAGFDIGVGRAGKTPGGKFVIAERLKHPVYRTSDGRVFKHGESENQLGDYFLKLVSEDKKTHSLEGFGIHGTPDETTVTRSLSNGCIRMRNADVEKLYHLVPSGTSVNIGD